MAELADWTAGAAERAASTNKGWIKYAVGGAAIVIALGLLFYTATQGNSQYYLTVEELGARSAEMVGKPVRVSGLVMPDSILYHAETLHLEFDIVDEIGSSQVPLRIVMDGEPLPDQMQNDAEAIAEGQLQADGTFRAESLMMKCASKYDVAVDEE